MVCKKHQMKADRALGILIDDGGHVRALICANDLYEPDADIDALVMAMRLIPPETMGRASAVGKAPDKAPTEAEVETLVISGCLQQQLPRTKLLNTRSSGVVTLPIVKRSAHFRPAKMQRIQPALTTLAITRRGGCPAEEDLC